MPGFPTNLNTAQITALVQGVQPSADPVNVGNWLVDLTKTALATLISVPAADKATATTAATAAMVAFATDYAPTVNSASIVTKLNANLATIETFITNNPAGASLTAGQTLVVARMLSGLCRYLLNEFNTTGGA